VGGCDIGTLRLKLGVRPRDDARGIVGWSLRGVTAPHIDGLPTEASAAPERPPAPVHPNGATGIDHVVVSTGDFDRTSTALLQAGLELRRTRDAGAAQQGFFRAGEAHIELVGPHARAHAGEAGGSCDRAAAFWGLVVVVEDIDALAARLGTLLGAVKDAVQPGRRIATLRQEAGVGAAVAFMTPRPPESTA